MIVPLTPRHWRQRETGSAFAVNAGIETLDVALLSGAPETVHTPSASGVGQKIVRCPECRVALLSHYPQLGALLAFVRVGTLDMPSLCPPDAHIFTSTRQSWFELPAGAPRFDEFYEAADRAALYGEDGAARLGALIAMKRAAG